MNLKYSTEHTQEEYSFQEFWGYQLITPPIFQLSRTNWLQGLRGWADY